MHQVLEPERLLDEVDHPRRFAGLSAVGRDDHHRRRTVLAEALHRPQEIHPIHHGHPQIEQDEAWLAFSEQRERLFAVGGNQRLIAMVSENVPDRVANMIVRRRCPATVSTSGMLFTQGEHEAGEAHVRMLVGKQLPGVEAKHEERSAPETPRIDVADEEGTGAKGRRIRCPLCQWKPTRDSRWSCRCGHVWNTFDTGGQCPQCGHAWKYTACLRCHAWSRHEDWYEKPDDAG